MWNWKGDRFDFNQRSSTETPIKPMNKWNSGTSTKWAKTIHIFTLFIFFYMYFVVSSLGIPKFNKIFYLKFYGFLRANEKLFFKYYLTFVCPIFLNRCLYIKIMLITIVAQMIIFIFMHDTIILDKIRMLIQRKLQF